MQEFRKVYSQLFQRRNQPELKYQERQEASTKLRFESKVIAVDNCGHSGISQDQYLGGEENCHMTTSSVF
jgi:RNA polymerase-interacting CarD/CdnL/TRCF family regulator